MVDELETGDNKYLIGPCFVIGKEQMVHVHIGVLPDAAKDVECEGNCGLYVSDEDYDKIDHKQPYFFVHDLDAKFDVAKSAMQDYIATNGMPELPSHPESMGREHVHFQIKIQFEEE